jgi:hypothetical protein
MHYEREIYEMTVANSLQFGTYELFEQFKMETL